MMFQPAIVRKCPNCHDFMYIMTKSSRFGTTGCGWSVSFWTDGKIAVESSLVDPKFVTCPHCDTMHWTDGLDHCGEIVCAEQILQETRNVKRAKVPSFKAYLRIIEAGSRAEVRYARIGLMWRYNDNRRRETSKAPSPLFHETSNLNALAELLEEDTANDILLKAEVMRELGYFDEAQAFLNKACNNENFHLVETIKCAAEKGDTRVMKVAL